MDHHGDTHISILTCRLLIAERSDQCAPGGPSPHTTRSLCEAHPLSHLHDFSVSLRLSKRLSAVTVLSVSVAGASQMRLTFVSFGRVSLSLTAGLRRHNS